MGKKESKKKKKVTYIDDGSTIADMSGIGSGIGGKKQPYSTLEDKKTTFFRAMRQMFIPMLVTMGFICLIFLIAYLMLW